MYVPKLLRVMSTISLLLYIHSQDNAYAQAEQQRKVTFEVVSQEALPAVDLQAQRIIILRDKKMRLASLSAKEGKRVLSIQDGPQVTLPRNLPALVARHGGMILQYGDERDLSHPVVTNLYWLNAEGKEVGSSEDYYRADALVALSDDGFTVVVGSRIKESRGKVIALFNGNGERLWERHVGEKRNVHSEPVVTNKGERIALVTTDIEKPLKDHRVLILDKQGNELSSISTMVTVQKIAAVGNGKALFVQGKKRHGLIDLSTGGLVWSNEGNVRMIAPRAAAMSPGADVLFLLLGDWQGRPKASYQWRIKAMDAVNGQEIGMWELPKEMPSSWSDVFGRITDDRINIFIGPDQLSISWSR